jgi:hypothetical protein
MQQRMVAFVLAYFAGFCLIGTVALDANGHLMAWPPLLWFLLCAVLQFFLFRCPHCRALAFYRGGWSTPFVGRQCEKCGKDY